MPCRDEQKQITETQRTVDICRNRAEAYARLAEGATSQHVISLAAKSTAKLKQAEVELFAAQEALAFCQETAGRGREVVPTVGL